MSPFFEALGGLWLFLLVMVGSPGPANLLALSAGARAGLRPVLPFICGLVAGKLLLNMLLGVGLLSSFLSADGAAGQLGRSGLAYLAGPARLERPFQNRGGGQLARFLASLAGASAEPQGMGDVAAGLDRVRPTAGRV